MTRRRRQLFRIIAAIDAGPARYDRPELDDLISRLASTLRRSPLTAWEANVLGWVFHHTSKATSGLQHAYQLGEIAARSHVPKSDWLMITSFDRLRVTQGRPQRFGTQYRLDRAAGVSRLLPVDEKEAAIWRKKMGLESLDLVPRELPSSTFRGPT